ncbi:MAG: hypothetical protein ACON34_06435 [Flavobacteriales bacterium]
MNSKLFRYVEIAWLVIGVIALGVAIYEINTLGFDQGKVYLLLPAIAFVWFGFRRAMRKRMERNMGE